jgi:hypothetical protein
LAFKQAGIPKLFCESSKTLEQFWLLSTKIGKEEVFAQRWHMEEGMYYDVHVIISFDVVQSNIAWSIGLVIKIVGWFGQLVGGVKDGDGTLFETGCQNVGDIFQGWIRDGITVRQYIYLPQSFQL